MNEDIKDEAYDEKKRELIWNQYFPRVRLAVWINCIAAVVSYVILVILTPAFTTWLKPDHGHYIGIIFPFAIILTLTDVIAVCRGKEHTRMDIVFKLSLLETLFTVITFLIFWSRSGGHLSLYEITGIRIMVMKSIISIVCCLGIYSGYRNLGANDTEA